MCVCVMAVHVCVCVMFVLFWQAPKLKKVEVAEKEVGLSVSINGPFELPKIMVCWLLLSYRKPVHLRPHCPESLPRLCSINVSAIN